MREATEKLERLGYRPTAIATRISHLSGKHFQAH